MVKNKVSAILSELEVVLDHVDEAVCHQLIDTLIQAKQENNKVYCAGAGRSLLMIRTFAMRLMHLGYPSYVVGETATPSIQTNDVLIFGSGSGETGALTIMMKKAKEMGAKIILFTYSPNSTLGKAADVVIEIPIHKSDSKMQPNGSVFEQSMLVLCDALVVELLDAGKYLQDIEINAFIKQLHANLE